MNRKKSQSCSVSKWQYKNLKKIGQGSSSQVYEAEHPQYNNVSIKIIESSFINNKIGSKLVQNEIKILSQIAHKNVIKFIQSQQKDGKTLIITSLYKKDDLEKVLKKKKKLDILTTLKILLDIIEGCQYLFSKGIFHRDLKPANIFFDNKNTIIADFGFAVHESNNNLLNINVGSPLYMAPQSLKKKKYSKKSQIFSLGVIAYEMLMGKTPWTANSEIDLIEKMKRLPPNCSVLPSPPQLRQIILKCLSFDPNHRPDIKDLKKIVLSAEKSISLEKKRNLSTNQDKQNKAPLAMNKFVASNKKLASQNLLKLDEFKENSDQKQPKDWKILKEVSFKQNINSRVEKAENQNLIIEFVEKIKPSSLTFLPLSLIKQLQVILMKYKSIVRKKSNNEKNLEGSTNVQIQKLLDHQSEKDQLIKNVIKSENEKQLCLTIEGFIRRLYRLIKNYKQYRQQMKAISSLHQIILSVIS